MAVNASSSSVYRAAYCDVDGTLTDTTIVTPLVWMKVHTLAPPWNWLWLASLAGRAPWWWCVDQFSRRASNVAIYSNYRGVSVAKVRSLASDYYQQRIKPKLFPHALDWIRARQSEGVKLVLVTGGLDLFMEPMARDFQADCLAPALEEQDGCFTGRLQGEPFTGAQKAAAVRQHARANGMDLAQSFALGDAIGDLAMMECAGNPVAVNPDRRLLRVAAQRNWKTETWT
ncbi:MAG: HAD-IB family hydrolase [Verrucomicrobiota bacterium]